MILEKYICQDSWRIERYSFVDSYIYTVVIQIYWLYSIGRFCTTDFEQIDLLTTFFKIYRKLTRHFYYILRFSERIQTQNLNICKKNWINTLNRTQNKETNNTTRHFYQFLISFLQWLLMKIQTIQECVYLQS